MEFLQQLDQEMLLLGVVFVSVFLAVLVVTSAFRRQRDIERTMERARSREVREDNIDKLLGSENRQLRYYLDVVQNAPQNSLRMRLVQAGYFDPSHIWKFNFLRFIAAAGVFAAVQIALPLISNEASRTLILVIGAMLGGIAFVLCSFILERIAVKRMREFRKIFPDLMDLLLVCVDAGLSIDAALDRVTREFLQTVPDFGVQLSIINLEIRAGRALHDALHNFAGRIRVEEARTLAVLFRQSQELGSSVSRTLRTFAREMRQNRIIRAEEKANLLPIKMLFPMALFMFPVSLLIVLVPVMISLIELLTDMMPG